MYGAYVTVALTKTTAFIGRHEPTSPPPALHTRDVVDEVIKVTVLVVGVGPTRSDGSSATA